MKLRIEDFFLDYLEDRLPESKRRRISAALAGSERLRTELNEFEQILKISRSAGALAPDTMPDLSEGVLDRIQDMEPLPRPGVIRTLSADRFMRENVLFVLGVCFAVLISSLAVVTIIPGHDPIMAAREPYPMQFGQMRIAEALQRSAGMIDELLCMAGLLAGVVATGLSAALKRYGLAVTFLLLTGLLFLSVVVLPVLAL